MVLNGRNYGIISNVNRGDIMGHITDINKDLYIDESKEIVRTTMALDKIELSDEELTILTKEIMDTSLMMGGDFAKDNIRAIAVQYLRSGFLERFKKAHRR